jgi:hypothetical protein
MFLVSKMQDKIIIGASIECDIFQNMTVTNVLQCQGQVLCLLDLQLLQFHTLATVHSVRSGRKYIGCKQFMNILYAVVSVIQRLLMSDSTYFSLLGIWQ